MEKIDAHNFCSFARIHFLFCPYIMAQKYAIMKKSTIFTQLFFNNSIFLGHVSILGPHAVCNFVVIIPKYIGEPGKPLIQSVKSPEEVLQEKWNSNGIIPNLRPNTNYYITKVIIPPLSRYGF